MQLSLQVVVIIISREIIVSVFRAVAASEGIVIAASPWGKAKTISQIIAIVTLLFNNYPFSLYNIPFDTIAIWATVILTVISGYDYIYKNKQVLMQTVFGLRLQLNGLNAILQSLKNKLRL